MRGWTSSMPTAPSLSKIGSKLGRRTISEEREGREDCRAHTHRLRTRDTRPCALPLLARLAADQEAEAAGEADARDAGVVDRRPDGIDREDAAGPRARPDDHHVQPAHRRARDLAADALAPTLRDGHLG